MVSKYRPKPVKKRAWSHFRRRRPGEGVSWEALVCVMKALCGVGRGGGGGKKRRKVPIGRRMGGGGGLGGGGGGGGVYFSLERGSPLVTKKGGRVRKKGKKNLAAGKRALDDRRPKKGLFQAPLKSCEIQVKSRVKGAPSGVFRKRTCFPRKGKGGTGCPLDQRVRPF